MDARQDKGRALAKCGKRIKRVEGALWFVPSQTQNAGGYLVNVLAASCSCPDHELRRGKCKHQWAVEFSQIVETNEAGEAVVTESVTVKRKYTQNWPAYNAAQCEEKSRVQTLLRGLCDGIVNPSHPGPGRKPLPLGDAVYGMAMKVYTTVSGRRASTDIKACETAGLIEKAPRYNTIFDYFNKPSMTPLLTTLVGESAAPLVQVESKFAVDSTGFNTSNYRCWTDHKHGGDKREHGWIKAHAMVGTTTNVITALTVTASNVNDSPELPGLVKSTAQRFTNIHEISADKAYLSHANLAAIEAVGAVPYIPFKSNSKAAGPAAWKRMWATFMLRQDEFLAHYHQRSNVEVTFSAMKRKFGSFVRSENPVAQTNELLCKALCFNLSTLVHAIHELQIEPPFCTMEIAS